jgi:hypothetical protein
MKVMVKKVTHLAGLLLLLVCGNGLGESLEFRGVFSNHTQLPGAFTLPESGGLIVLGSVLISGATLLRRRWSARRRETR